LSVTRARVFRTHVAPRHGPFVIGLEHERAGERTALSPTRARIAFIEGYEALPAQSLPAFDMIEDLVSQALATVPSR
jgi:hypothetical protein